MVGPINIGTNFYGTWHRYLVTEPNDILAANWMFGVFNNLTRISRCWVYAGSITITGGTSVSINWDGTMLNRALPFIKGYTYRDGAWTDKYVMAAPNSIEPSSEVRICVDNIATHSMRLICGTVTPNAPGSPYAMKFYTWGV